MTTATAPQPTAPARPQIPRVPYEGLFVPPAYTDGLPYDREEDESDDGE
ncbi:hypothetical protein [Streptomyces caniscabiei]|nr:hypothetical protein [Streptomyces caniscabiei]MDX2986449.1 hypothetical protein [Streptomyces caniscabiei]